MIMVLSILACTAQDAAAPTPHPAPEPTADPVLVLDPPIAGRAGDTWAIQNHVDIDPGPGQRDSLGGRNTYDGHKGTDFRIHGLPAMIAGVEVLAPADGQVLRTRDGQDDRCGSGDRAQVPSDQACGNGMVIDHGGGFQTQLCHLRKGSLQVREGDRVQAGQPVGLVGWSGMAEFPHVHITVRHEDTLLDPFAEALVGPRAEWRSPAEVPPAAHRVWATGFSSSLHLDADELERSPAGLARLPDTADAIVAYAQALSNDGAPAWHMLARSPGGRLFEGDGAPTGRAEGLKFLGKRRRQGETLELGTWTAQLQVGEDPVREWSVEVVPGPIDDEPPPTWEGCATGG